MQKPSRQTRRLPAAALAALLLLAACNEGSREKVGGELRSGLTIVQDDAPIRRPFGTVMEATPGTLSQDEADRVREANLTKACATRETRTLEGRVLHDGRTCALVSVTGLIPTKTLLYEGRLQTAQGEMLEVAWIVQEGPGSLQTDVSAACRMDPTQGKSGPWRLSRNRPGNLWHLAPRDEWVDSRWSFSPDAVGELCTEREASARRIEAAVARQQGPR